MRRNPAPPAFMLPEADDEVLVAFRRRPVELTAVSVAEQRAVLNELARKGVHAALRGAPVQGASDEHYLSPPQGAQVLVNGRAVATVGVGHNGFDRDAHGCPACPHPALGVVATGFPGVLINGRSIAVAGSETSDGSFVAEGVAENPAESRSVSRTQSLAMRSILRRG